MPDYGMTEPEFLRELERHLNAIARAFARRFGITADFTIQVIRKDA